LSRVNVRYIVDDLDAAIAFYTERLDFGIDFRAPDGGIAALVRGDLRLLLSPRTGRGGASQAMPDGRKPEPGGWNRIQLEVADLAAKVATLRSAHANFRSDIIVGKGGRQIVVDDPSGNPIELFEPNQK
jgi:catechol 2,3-dioxygenase-like lactoylglutathione lyase family enzyme